jgi:hypothetical protein
LLKLPSQKQILVSEQQELALNPIYAFVAECAYFGAGLFIFKELNADINRARCTAKLK